MEHQRCWRPPWPARDSDQCLDEIISVNEVRIFKPSPRVYQLIGQKLRVSANQIGFVSSNSWDINGAGAAGLYTFWIQRSAGEPQEELGFPARQVVDTITELERLIRQAAQVQAVARLGPASIV